LRFRRARRTDPAINLTALIDILFTVLVFLVLTTTFRETTQISIELPGATTGARLNANPENIVRVTVAQDGSLFVSERPTSLAELRALFETVSSSESMAVSASVDTQVLLEADEHAEHGRVVEIMDLARSVGLSRLSIETTRTDRREP